MKKTVALVLLLGLLLSIPLSASADKTFLEEIENDSIDDAWKAYLADLKPVVDVAEGCYYTVLVFDDGLVQIPGSPRDGTCYPWFDLTEWKDIIAAAALYNEDVYRLAGLCKDGTVIVNDRYYSADRWDHVRQISCCEDSFGCFQIILGLRDDGTVLASGYFGARLGQIDFFQENLRKESWKDLKAIYACGDCAVGLKMDGSVVQSDEIYDFSNWGDIVQLSFGGDYIAGLRGDGTVVLTDRLTARSHAWTEEETKKKTVSGRM